ncbi:hypothetical protein JI743_02975 [Sphingopyxis sp. DHUNG17]|uniref:hypothetical protein n=1 Tax=Sphingopyxis jiangsuensis TaxID=2871171 RepID=UPI00191EE4E5|nr:hypothetical protein [Sphingopyxis lutea]MBL0767765.1 hypothetical protein [Sphingopyxis lutea]
MGSRNRRNRIDATGRSPTSRFARLDHAMLNTNAYRALSPNARSLLVELAMLENGSNNGSLYLSVRDAAYRLGVADLAAASRAFDDLTALGFIEMTKDAHFKVKAADKSRARCWRLTWVAGPGRKAPTSDFITREPEPKTQARRRMDRGLRALKAYRKARDSNQLPVLESETMPLIRSTKGQPAVSYSDTLKYENGGFAPKSVIPDSSTHTAAPWGQGAPQTSWGWWQPDWSAPVAVLAYAAAFQDARWREAA